MTRPELRLLLAAAALVPLAVPAGAQHQGHVTPGAPAPAPAQKPAAKKPAVQKPAAKKPAAKKPEAKKPTPPKPAAKRPAAGKPAAKRPAAKKPTTVEPPAAPANTADPQAGQDMSATRPAAGNEAPAGTDLGAGNAPPPPVPADHAADAVYGARGMAAGRHHLRMMHGGQKLGQVMLNIAEVQLRDGRDSFEWDGEGWYGGDIHRLWIKSSGEGEFGRPLDKAEVQALYSYAIDPYFNLQGGIRYDVKPDPSRGYAVIGIEGLAPGFFDVEGALFLSNKGELLARASGYYDQRITQRLILQPRAELNFAAQDSRATRTGAGLSDAELGLRLRYDIRREFAPYVGVHYRRAFGDTRRFLRQAGEDGGGWSLLTGIRFWF